METVMGIPVYITVKELRSIGRLLRDEREVLCMDEESYIKTLLVAVHRLSKGQTVRAKVVRAEIKDLTKISAE
jgi:hypothetical protein